MKNIILAAFAAIVMQFAIHAQNLSDYIGGKLLTEQKKIELLSYQGRSPLIQLEKYLYICKLDVDNGEYNLSDYYTYLSPRGVGYKLQYLIEDYDNLLAYFYSPEFKVLTWWDVYYTQHAVKTLTELHVNGPK